MNGTRRMFGVIIGIAQIVGGTFGLISFIDHWRTYGEFALGAVSFTVMFSVLSIVAGALLIARHRLGERITILVQAPQAFAYAGPPIIYAFSLGPSVLTTFQTSGCLASLSCYKMATYSSLIEPSLVIRDGTGSIGFGVGVNFVALTVLCLSVWFLSKGIRPRA